ncbi:hypothetical protein [Clostridium estertheticum]|uniref:hypothetical protein n=1 Tax=Clostridium estertheticum TaxID=238834 RepID=UPI001C0C2083|nr:hypothetical protein [Clostridium estertheticum]MBU3172472.1 hypothetical protein [Clostridium estertheticum]
MGYLWHLAYDEVKCDKHIKGTYCETIKCSLCGSEFYFNNVTIPIGDKYEINVQNVTSHLAIYIPVPILSFHNLYIC